MKLNFLETDKRWRKEKLKSVKKQQIRSSVHNKLTRL